MSLVAAKASDASSSETGSNDVYYDKTDKLGAAELGHDFDFDKEFAELDQLALESRKRKLFVQRILTFECELNFANKMHMVYILGIFSAFAGVLSGLDQLIISAASIGMGPALNLNLHENSLVSSLMPLGAVAGSIIMLPLNEWCGRRSSIMISCLWYTLGAALCAGAINHEMMYAGRFILGVGIGIEGGCVGIYISESVPPSVRGNIVSAYQGFSMYYRVGKHVEQLKEVEERKCKSGLQNSVCRLFYTSSA